ncbi:MAG: hypothetical protein JO305_02245 [Alphaproteobacteria bacterium]|nr:hypothetical protein [Alphaproteobacteria bacterium]
MRALVLACLVSLACLVLLGGCVPPVRVEGFAAADPANFIYTAHTNTVMTPNDDGAAERLRRDWLADAVRTHGMCANGYVVDTRRFVPEPDGPFGNDGDIVYLGRCL